MVFCMGCQEGGTRAQSTSPQARVGLQRHTKTILELALQWPPCFLEM